MQTSDWPLAVASEPTLEPVLGRPLVLASDLTLVLATRGVWGPQGPLKWQLQSGRGLGPQWAQAPRRSKAAGKRCSCL